MWIFGFGNWTKAVSQKWEIISNGGLFTEQDGISDDELKDLIRSGEAQDVASTPGHLQIGILEDTLSLGMSEEEVRKSFGEPSRVDPSPYGYTWWIYNQNWQDYIQIGVANGKVVTFYTNAPNWSWSGFSPGMKATDWQGKWPVKAEVSFRFDLSYFTFALTEKDQKERPLRIKNEEAVQLYIDVHNEESISGIRVMDLGTLLQQRPYALKYMGKLPASPAPSEIKWEAIEKAYEQQIFDIVNVTRHVFKLPPFKWHPEVSIVAKGHSLDMSENQYFDHHSPKKGSLGDRLEVRKVVYQSAGENIAWNYIDGADAHEGWLNSLGHRENVMQAEFSHLGVGVIHKYYTQNFLSLE
jgi:uncharacterized protein YkwD